MRAMRLTASAALLFLCACPPSAQPCADDSDCAAAEVCVVGAGAGTCQTVVSLDAGSVVDAGAPADAGVNDAGVADAGVADAGVRDEGLALRGTLQIAPGELRAGTKALRARVLGTGPATTVRGGTLILDAALNGAPP